MNYNSNLMFRNHTDYLYEIRYKVGIHKFWGINLHVRSWYVLGDGTTKVIMKI